MQDQKVFDSSIDDHVQSLQFCFTSILQMELNQLISLWSSHSIRTLIFNVEIFDVSEHYGVREMWKTLDLNGLIVAKAFLQEPLFCASVIIR